MPGSGCAIVDLWPNNIQLSDYARDHRGLRCDQKHEFAPRSFAHTNESSEYCDNAQQDTG